MSGIILSAFVFTGSAIIIACSVHAEVVRVFRRSR